MQQVAHAVIQAAQPAAKNQGVHVAAVGQQQLQQLRQVVGGPFARDVAFGKANVPRLQRLCEWLVAVQMQGGVERLARRGR